MLRNVKKRCDYKNVEKSEDYTNKWLGIVNYSILDSQLNGNNVAITTADYAENWRELSKEEYKEKKNAIYSILLILLKRYSLNKKKGSIK